MYGGEDVFGDSDLTDESPLSEAGYSADGLQESAKTKSFLIFLIHIVTIGVPILERSTK